MDPYDYDEMYADDGRYDDDPNPYHGDYSEEQNKKRSQLKPPSWKGLTVRLTVPLFYTGPQLNWLESRPVEPVVMGSSPIGLACMVVVVSTGRTPDCDSGS